MISSDKKSVYEPINATFQHVYSTLVNEISEQVPMRDFTVSFSEDVGMIIRSANTQRTQSRRLQQVSYLAGSKSLLSWHSIMMSKSYVVSWKR